MRGHKAIRRLIGGFLSLASTLSPVVIDAELEKVQTGIEGFDEITFGGLPKGRPTLICGSAGCGKTLFASEFLIRGAVEFNEPGVFVAFEETVSDIEKNVASLGFNVAKLIEEKKLIVDHIWVERNEIEETGEYDLEGLFIRLNYMIDEIGAKRIVLDTIETLFGGLSNEAVLRSELRRLFRWLKDKGVTAVITGERGEGQLTRQGLEEYVSDCVILLDNRVHDQVSTRRMRIVKYRGSTHGTNEYPFLIGNQGFTVMPVTSLQLRHGVSSKRVSSGVPTLDEMLGGKGFFRGTSVLVSGTAGTGKSSLGAHFANATCDSGGKAIYFAFEESPDQIVRNMSTIGLNLEKHVDSGALTIHATRPMHYGLEMHLATMQKMIRDIKPDAVIIDPVSNFDSLGSVRDVTAMLIRLVDFLKFNGISSMFLTLSSGGHFVESTEVGMSSIMDTWILLRDIELSGERNRGIYVLKSRGTAHSNQIREFVITSSGIELREVYLGAEGVLTGSARIAQEQVEINRRDLEREEISRRKMAAERRQLALQAQIAALQAEIESERLEAERLELTDVSRAERRTTSAVAMEQSRSKRAAPEVEQGSNGRKK